MNKPIEQLDAYLRGELSPEETQQFEIAMQNDKMLAETVAQQKKLLNVVDLLGDQETGQRLHQVARDYHDRQTIAKPRIMKKSWLAIAAAIALLLSAYLFLQRESNSPQELYASYIDAYPLDAGVRSGGNDTSALLLEATQRYTAGEFRQAVPLLDRAFEWTADTKWTLAKAVSQIQLGNHEDAINVLLPLVNEKDVLYEEPARWYLALCYLHQERLADAKATLKELTADGGGFKKEEALGLLQALERIGEFAN